MNKNINRPSSRSTSRCSRGQQKKSEKKQKQQHNQLKINKSHQLNFWIPTSEKIVRKAYSSGGGGFVGDEENTKEEKEIYNNLLLFSSSMLQQPPHRSQSFRHRPRPNTLIKGRGGGDYCGLTTTNLNNWQNIVDTAEIEATNDSTPERRRSTPTIHRRASLRGGSRFDTRLDTWPEPKQGAANLRHFFFLP